MCGKVLAQETEKGDLWLSQDSVRTVSDSSGTPILEIIKEEDTITIFEADDMDRQVEFPSALIPALIQFLENLK